MDTRRTMTSAIQPTIDNDAKILLWTSEIFHLPNNAKISILSVEPSSTNISIIVPKFRDITLTIDKPISEITYDDIKQLASDAERKFIRHYPIRGRIFRFLGWSIGFSGLYMMFAVCPFCGQAGCPVGAASAGVVGGLFTLSVSALKSFWNMCKRKLHKFNRNHML